jgi:ADP-L-glycero-D-manno-heptose 6-epimerase
MYVITGALGFIGSNLARQLEKKNQEDLIIVDLDGQLATSEISVSLLKNHQFLSSHQFLEQLKSHKIKNIKGIYHNGACTDTTEWDGEKMMRLNYNYSKELLDICLKQDIPLVYASSGSVYGASLENDDRQLDGHAPLNVYGYSKLLFDMHVQARVLNAPNMSRHHVVGLRYFNVYGPDESHKGKMASTIWHFSRQALAGEAIKLFKGSHGYQDGRQERDFIYVNDIVELNLWAMERCLVSGIYNAGTSIPRAFNDVADAIINFYGKGSKEYIPFPENLLPYYQSYTCATLNKLREAGYKGNFASLEKGINDYLSKMEQVK